jgi:hypothetical protein
MTTTIPSIRSLVNHTMEIYLRQGKLHELTFKQLNELIREYYPHCQFNAAHFAYYKHHFLRTYGQPKLSTRRGLTSKQCIKQTTLTILED